MTQDGRVDQPLSQREQELADFVENAVVGLHWVAADGTIVWVNQAELDLLGYAREEYIGHPIGEFHDDQVILEDILNRLRAGEKLLNYEARLRCKDGSIRDVLISSNGRFEDGQFLHTRCFTIDVTAKKQVEARILSLYQLTAALSLAQTRQEVAQLIVEQGISHLHASAGSVVGLNNAQSQLEIVAASGYAAAALQGWQHFPLDSRVPLAECVRTQQPIWIHDRQEFQTRYPQADALYPPGSPYRSWAAIPLGIQRRVIGALGLSFSTPQRFEEADQQFLLALAHQCAQAFERTRLAEEARDRAVLEERQRLARELHDSVSQTLFSVHSLAQALPRLIEKDPQETQHHLQHLTMLSRAALSEMRTLLLELRPTGLLKASLPDLLTGLVNAVQARQDITLTVQVEVEQPLPDEVHLALYRIAQEALNNIVKHSEATAGSITCIAEAGQVQLRIQDNGRGFNPDQVAAGLGLGGMRERAELIGATLQINSQVGGGTEIIVHRNFPV